MENALVVAGVVLLLIGTGVTPNQYRLPLREAISLTSFSRAKATLFALGFLFMVAGAVIGVAA